VCFPFFLLEIVIPLSQENFREMVGAILLHDSALINIVSLEECISEFTEIKKAIVSSNAVWSVIVAYSS